VPSLLFDNHLSPLKMTATTFLRYGFLLLLTAGLFSCKKFVSVPLPVDQLNAGEVFTDDKTATAAIVGIYSDMEFNLPVSTFLTVLPGLSADELTYTSGDVEYFEMATNTYLPDHPYTDDVWSIYSTIYEANACIQGIQKSTGLSPATKNQLLGEALFSRAFCYFYLVNLFGDVPLVTSTDYRINDTLSRTASAMVYQQIIADLETAQNLLSSDYPTAQRVRPNSRTAGALLSRVYLYSNRWKDAENQVSDIINSGLYSLSGLDSVFLNFSPETIWQLLPVNPSFNTQEAPIFFPNGPSQVPLFPLTNDLVAAFELGDKRLSAWTGTNNIGGQLFYYPAKYKNTGGSPVTEYHIVFRLAEQYLIRAEARVEQDNISGAVEDLNTIRSRAGLIDLPATLTPDAAMAAIQQERRIELFAEFGHRWLDLKRTSRVSAVIGALKPATWTPAAALWPIPQSQISANPNLTQNTGY
jgi:starch-binding outer membrane protein, SusD/RagB family